jgi:hypothetical protein
MKEPNKFAGMSTGDFKDRIKAIKRGLDPDEEHCIGAPHAHPCVLRPKGSQPTPSETLARQDEEAH